MLPTSLYLMEKILKFYFFMLFVNQTFFKALDKGNNSLITFIISYSFRLLVQQKILWKYRKLISKIN